MNRRLYIICRKLVQRRYFCQSQSEMAKCIARQSTDDNICLNFDYGVLETNSKSFHFNRLKSEKIQNLVERMKHKIITETNKKSKKKKKKVENSEKREGEVTDIAIHFEVDGTKVNVDECSLQDVCVPGAVMYVGDRKYDMVINPPTIVSMKLPKQIMQGYPVYPTCEVQFADLMQSSWTWQRINKLDPNNRKVLGTGSMYTPSVEDIGYFLSVSCLPKLCEQSGEEMTVQSTTVVEAGPGQCPFELRHLFTTETSRDGCFRVVTYNILGDCYADTTFTKTQLYPYCASYALSLDYRIQLLLKEILGYKADVICLQEVDRKIFKRHFDPILSLNNFEGMFKEKNGTIVEGEALFFRTSKFRLIEERNINLTEQLKTDPQFSDILEKVKPYEAVTTELELRGTVLQVALLKSLENPKKTLVVGNTHLFFHRDFDHIRVVQGAICLRHLQLIQQSLTEKGEDVSVMFCGDFNANPKSGLYELVTSGKITPDHSHMTIKATGEKLDSMTFHHNFDLRNACGEQRYTNYVGGFHGVLDYMFIDQTLDVTSVVPMPSHEEVTQHTALPSVVFPSDHIAQICDITWK